MATGGTPHGTCAAAHCKHNMYTLYSPRMYVNTDHNHDYICAKKQHVLDKIIIIGYWLDMEIYVRVLVRSNIARRQEHNINYAPERVYVRYVIDCKQ